MSAADTGLTPAALARYVAWQDATRKKGGVPVRMPTGANLGDLAERYGRPGAWRYVLAPVQIRADDRSVSNQLIINRAKGRAADAITSTVTTVRNAARAVASAPRTVAATALGVPKWAVTALIVAALAYGAWRFTNSTNTTKAA